MALLSKVENRKAILVVINCILMIASLILIGRRKLQNYKLTVIDPLFFEKSRNPGCLKKLRFPSYFDDSLHKEQEQV